MSIGLYVQYQNRITKEQKRICKNINLLLLLVSLVKPFDCFGKFLRNNLPFGF